MRSVPVAAAVLLLPLLAAAAAAQEARVDVVLNHTGNDALGKRLATALARELGAGKRLQLVKDSPERIGVYLTTMGHGESTIYAATWTFGDIADEGYLTSKVGACEPEAIRACARSLLAETDKHAGVLSAAKTPPRQR